MTKKKIEELDVNMTKKKIEELDVNITKKKKIELDVQNALKQTTPSSMDNRRHHEVMPDHIYLPHLLK